MDILKMSKIKNQIYFLKKKTRNWYRFFSALFSALMNFNNKYFIILQKISTFSVSVFRIFQNHLHISRYDLVDEKNYGKVSLREIFFLIFSHYCTYYVNKTKIIILNFYFCSESLF